MKLPAGRLSVIFATLALASLAVGWTVVAAPKKKVAAGKNNSAGVLESFSLPSLPATDAVAPGEQHLKDAKSVPPDTRRTDAKANNFVSVEFQTRGYCYAASQLKDPTALGGFGESDNLAQPVATRSGQGLFLLAQPEVVSRFGKHRGMRLVLVNQTRDLLAFKASDSRLNIIQEAQDETGKWKPIEYLPSSWCGNSYHRVLLSPGHFWEFAAPRYKGSVKAKLRFAMRLGDKTQRYSNVFEGSINPKQFTEKQGHMATNIMDPYDD